MESAASPGGGRADGKLCERACQKCIRVTVLFQTQRLVLCRSRAEQGARKTGPPHFFIRGTEKLSQFSHSISIAAAEAFTTKY